MFNILEQLYTVHHNILAVMVLLIVIALFFLSKKNIKALIAVIAIIIVANIGCYNMTKNKTWTREFYLSDKLPKSYTIYERVFDSIPQIEFRDSLKVSFGTDSKTPWVVYGLVQDSNKQVLHWCWIDDYWERFSETDLVSWIWGENAGKKIRGSSEARLNYTSGE